MLRRWREWRSYVWARRVVKRRIKLKAFLDHPHAGPSIYDTASLKAGSLKSSLAKAEYRLQVYYDLLRMDDFPVAEVHSQCEKGVG